MPVYVNLMLFSVIIELAVNINIFEPFMGVFCEYWHYICQTYRPHDFWKCNLTIARLVIEHNYI